MDKLTIRDADVAGKRVFVRVDFNVPLADGKVTDDSRIRAALPTITSLLGAGARVILASHLGRPDGKVSDSLRLRPVGQRLSELLRRNVPVTGDALGVGTEDAVKRLLELCDVLVVVGSTTSSNSNRLRELADRAGIPGYLVDGPDNLQEGWFEGRRAVGVTAGASAPELLVQQVVERLRSWGGTPPAVVVGREENVVFSLPRALRAARTG